jgi:hypothetical protein
VVVNFSKFYAKADSPQLDAWDAYWREKHGRNLMRDKNGGWYVESEWPPGHVPREMNVPVEIPQPKSMGAA